VLVSVSMPVLTTLIMHIAGQSRGTAGGMFTASAQAGGVIGSSAGGLMLSLGSYPAVGVLFLVASVLSASVVGLIIRRSPAFKLRGSDTWEPKSNLCLEEHTIGVTLGFTPTYAGYREYSTSKSQTNHHQKQHDHLKDYYEIGY